MVNADDFAYGIERNLDPVNASPYAYLLGFVLKGASDFSAGTTKDFSTVGVNVVDAKTIPVDLPLDSCLQCANRRSMGRPTAAQVVSRGRLRRRR